MAKNFYGGIGKLLTDTRGIVSWCATDRKSPPRPHQRAPVRGENDPFSTTSILESRGESFQTAKRAY